MVRRHAQRERLVDLRGERDKVGQRSLEENYEVASLGDSWEREGEGEGDFDGVTRSVDSLFSRPLPPQVLVWAGALAAWLLVSFSPLPQYFFAPVITRAYN